MKLDPQRIPDLPEPRPRFEIWVYSPRVEGVHLRFGPVARGGLRWSDRREDFRTEILGLVKAQMVKNAVIVPTGAKGGFVAKQLPDPAVDRDAWLAEGVACYRTFISLRCSTSPTTTSPTPTARRRVVPPPQVRRYDGDDPYLVVAADKGTATFSDIANGIATDYGFWLGDAFASRRLGRLRPQGDGHHRARRVGVGEVPLPRARHRHRRRQDFTVVGIGDMSGDVFGNGMLLSEHIRLVAAFDHRHVFLDPNPDAATSYAERRRLFDLPRSSWADYDTSLITAGGGVYARTLKSIPITRAGARRRSGFAPASTKLTPTELIHAILRRAGRPALERRHRHLRQGVDRDRSSTPATRPTTRCASTATSCAARVVGEGGNLGFTQLGRDRVRPRAADGSTPTRSTTRPASTRPTTR